MPRQCFSIPSLWPVSDSLSCRQFFLPGHLPSCMSPWFTEYWDGPSLLHGGCSPLKADHLSWAPLPFRAHSHEISLASSLNKPKSALLNTRVCALPLSCHPPLPQELDLHYIKISHQLPQPKSVLPSQWTADPAVHHPLWFNPGWPIQYLYNKKLPLTSSRISPGWLASSHVALPGDVRDIPLLSESFYDTKTSLNFSKISPFSSPWSVLTHPHHSITVTLCVTQGETHWVSPLTLTCKFSPIP